MGDFRYLVRRQKNDPIFFLGGQFVEECAYSIEQYFMDNDRKV